MKSSSNHVLIIRQVLKIFIRIKRTLNFELNVKSNSIHETQLHEKKKKKKHHKINMSVNI
jgi:hypothetical protein